jgi:ubiquinone/menaquinone biosynthesis C-methylase UbiE
MTPGSAEAIRRLYDRIGTRYDWFEFYEGKARRKALQLLALEAEMSVLYVGVGSGKEHQVLCQAVMPDGVAFGLDLS